MYKIEKLLLYYPRNIIVEVIQNHGHCKGLRRFPWDMFVSKSEWIIIKKECEELL